MAPTLLTTPEVAEIFRVNDATVTRWAREGTLPAVKVPATKAWLFRRTDVDRLLNDLGIAS